MNKRMRTLSFPHCLLALAGVLFVFILLPVEASAQGVVTRKTPVSAKKAPLRKSQGAAASQKKSSQKKYFKVETSFKAESATERMYATYNTDGTCYMIGWIWNEEQWVRGDGKGTYYMKEANASQKVLYVTWGGCPTEKYILSNGTYRDGRFLFRKAYNGQSN